MTSFTSRGALAFAMACLVCVPVLAEDPPVASDTDLPSWSAEVDKALDPDNFDAPTNRLEAAEKTLREAIEQGAGAEAHLTLAELLMAADKNDDARKLFGPSLESDDAGTRSRALTMAYMLDSNELRAKMNALRGKKDTAGQKAVTAELRKVHETFLEALGGDVKARAAYTRLRGTLKKLGSLGALGAPITNIDRPDLEGKTIALDSYQGKVVLLDFWAVWCGPCVREMPNVIAAYNELHERGFDIVGISLDKDEKRLNDYITKNKMPWRQYFDGKGWKNEVAQEWGVRSIPATYLIDHEGLVRYVGLRGEALKAKIELLLKRAEEAAQKAEEGACRLLTR